MPMPIPTIVSGAAFCIECMRANGMFHKEDCSLGLDELARLGPHAVPIIEIRSEAPAIDDLALVQEQIAAIAADPSESMVIERGRDGERWRFFGSKRGDMIEVVRVEPDGSVKIAPHATPADLRTAIEVLGYALHEAQRIPGTEPAEWSVDVVIC